MQGLADDLAGRKTDHTPGNRIDIGEATVEVLHVDRTRHVLHEEANAHLAFLPGALGLCAKAPLVGHAQGMCHDGQQPRPVDLGNAVECALTQRVEFELLAVLVAGHNERNADEQ